MMPYSLFLSLSLFSQEGRKQEDIDYPEPPCRGFYTKIVCLGTQSPHPEQEKRFLPPLSLSSKEKASKTGEGNWHWRKE
jgi:hypothetical protein